MPSAKDEATPATKDKPLPMPSAKDEATPATKDKPLPTAKDEVVPETKGEAVPAVALPKGNAAPPLDADAAKKLAEKPTAQPAGNELCLLQGLNALLIDNKMLTQETQAQDKAQDKAQHRSEGPPELGGPGQWVSTVAKARSRTAPPQALTDMMQTMQGSATSQPLASEPNLRSAWHAASQGQPAGQLVATLGQAESMDLSILGEASVGLGGEQHAGSPGSHSGQGGQRGGDSPRVNLEAIGQMRGASAEVGPANDFASLMGEAMGETLGKGLDNAFNQLADEVSLWAAGQTRKASLVLQTGLREAMEVDVSLNGDQAQLVFRTDDQQAREAIRAHAHDLLTEMLSQAGLGLESLSVGGRDAGQSGESKRERLGHSDRPRPTGNEGVTEVVQQHLGSRSGVGLSIYA